jgi:DNA-binding response OmpR family regulator
MATRILIVEENRQVVDELRDNLELAGFEPEVALNFQVALTILEERKMNLAILGTSIQDVGIIRKLHELDKELKILFLTEQKSKRYKSSLLKAGVSSVIELPVEKDNIIATIEVLTAKTKVLPVKVPLRKPARKVAKKKREKKKKSAS